MTTPLTQPIFYGPKVVVLTGFPCTEYTWVIYNNIINIINKQNNVCGTDHSTCTYTTCYMQLKWSMNKKLNDIKKHHFLNLLLHVSQLLLSPNQESWNLKLLKNKASLEISKFSY